MSTTDYSLLINSMDDATLESLKNSSGKIPSLANQLIATPDLTQGLGSFPIGTIYLSVSSTSPASLFGGTWEQLKDKFLLGAGDTYTNGATGGESTHTLTVNEMPSHTHTLPVKFGWGAGASNTGPRTDSNNPGTDWYTAMNSTGGGQAHNNMPPYLVVYMWKRTA